MILAVSLSALAAVSLAAPNADPSADPHGFYGHVYHGPICKHEFEEEVKEVCYYDHPDKMCETKTSTYKIVTGFEKRECKEIDVCGAPSRMEEAQGSRP